MARQTSLRITNLVVFAALASAAAAPADWLVTRGGERLETAGAWQVKGKVVVFTAVGGPLSSLRLSEVDLEASRRATTAPASAVPATDAAPGIPRREAKVVLTDESFRRASPPATSLPADKAEGDGSGEPEGDAVKPVVSGWERVRGEDGHVVIRGTVRNDAPSEAAGVVVAVSLYDEAGSLLSTGNSVLSSTVLPAGQAGSFQADFPGVFSFAAARFETSALHFLREAGEPARHGDGERPVR